MKEIETAGICDFCKIVLRKLFVRFCVFKQSLVYFSVRKYDNDHKQREAE